MASSEEILPWDTPGKFWELYESGEYSDFTIKCDDKTFKVHKAIIAPQSSFFKAACGGDFLESKTGVIDLQDVDPKVVEKMIEFFYKGQYSTDCRRRVDKAIFHAKMFATAEMYNASGLQTAALDRFSSAFSDCWNYELPFVIEFALTCVPAHVEDLRTEVVSSLDRRRSWLKTPSICTVVKTFDLTYDLLKRAYLPGPEFEDSDDE